MYEIFLFIVGTLLAVCGFLMVFILNGIKGEMKDIKGSLSLLENDMRNGLSGVGHRVTVLETRCGLVDKKECSQWLIK